MVRVAAPVEEGSHLALRRDLAGFGSQPAAVPEPGSDHGDQSGDRVALPSEVAGLVGVGAGVVLSVFLLLQAETESPVPLERVSVSSLDDRIHRPYEILPGYVSLSRSVSGRYCDSLPVGR